MNEKEIANRKLSTKKYYCSIHGGNGYPNCRECWEKLYKLAKDNDAIVVGP